MIFKKNIISDILKVSYRSKHDWIKPDGFDTGIKIYNCITKSKEPLIFKNKHLIKWYTCGPTVYDSSHVGHASCYVKLDIIQKILKRYFNFNIVHVMNITDIDDKIIKKAQLKKTEYQIIAKQYEREFWKDLVDLGIDEPDVIVRVSENINSIINYIQELEKSGYAYTAKDNSVYFDVGRCENYGKLQNIADMESNNSSIKKSILDFALWKSSKPGEPFWSSPWGDGRPGWHIECSALASNTLGSNIDIHAGGIDLRFPHHENEEAQSCAYHHTSQWINYWIHTGHLRLKDTVKMSKSLGNTVSIQEMLKLTSAEDFRMGCVMSPYRNIMEYDVELLANAKSRLKSYKNLLDSCIEFKNGFIKASINSDVLQTTLVKSRDDIHEALCDDFNTAKVLKILDNLASCTNSMLATVRNSQTESDSSLGAIASVHNTVKWCLNLFGIDFDKTTVKDENFVNVMNILNTFRQDIRNIGLESENVDILKQCDIVRDDLKKCNITLKDHKKVSSWRS